MKSLKQMMRYGPRALMTSLVLLICSNAGAAPAMLAGDGVLQTLQDLEEKMRQIENMQTGFIQRKKLSSFKNEIELRGSIYLQKPGRFAWHTETPVRYSMVFKDGKLYQWNEDTDRVQVLEISDAPALGIVMEQLQTWLSGSYAALLGQYDIRVLSEAPLVLEFTPRETAFSFGMIKSLNIRFRQDRSYIESIRIEEQNGDLSNLNFTGTVLNKEMDPSVWRMDKRAA